MSMNERELTESGLLTKGQCEVRIVCGACGHGLNTHLQRLWHFILCWGRKKHKLDKPEHHTWQ